MHYLAPGRAHAYQLTRGERMNAELKVHEPRGRAARRVLETAVIGWPEKLRASTRSCEIVDGAIARQLPVIKRYAQEKAAVGLPRNEQDMRRRTV